MSVQRICTISVISGISLCKLPLLNISTFFNHQKFTNFTNQVLRKGKHSTTENLPARYRILWTSQSGRPKAVFLFTTENTKVQLKTPCGIQKDLGLDVQTDDQ